MRENWYTPDFILTLCANRMRFIDCKVDSSAPASTHFPITAKIRAALRVSRRRKKRKIAPAVKWLGLRDPAKARAFISEAVDGCTTPAYSDLVASISTAAKIPLLIPLPKILPGLTSPATPSSPSSIKNEAQSLFKTIQNADARNAFSLARKQAKKVVWAAKLKWLELQSKEMKKMGTQPYLAWKVVAKVKRSLSYHHKAPASKTRQLPHVHRQRVRRHPLRAHSPSSSPAPTPHLTPGSSPSSPTPPSIMNSTPPPP